MGYVLIADDEKAIRNVLRIYLDNAGYEVLEAANGQEAVAAVRQSNVDLVLLDIMMPVLDGYEALRQIRETSNVPVILLSAKGEDPDKILGLNLGADDYLAKPFNPLEVMARVGAAIRRYTRLGSAAPSAGAAPVTPPLTVADLVLCTDEATLTRGGEAIALTPVELRMMELFMTHPGRVYTKQQIFEYAWQQATGPDGYAPVDNSVMVGISKLRAKLAADPHRYIQTIRGIGYRIAP